MGKNEQQKNVCVNRKANYEYFLGKKYEAGLCLHGTEVKSVSLSQCQLTDSFIRIEHGEAFVYGLHISPYDHGNIWNQDADRPKKLLLHKSEIRSLENDFKTGGIALIPTRVYFSNGKAKLEFSVCKGKHLYDKRQTIAKRDSDRVIQKEFKEANR